MSNGILLVFIPIIILSLVLAVTALIHVLRNDNYRFGNRVMWVLIVLFVTMIGPLAYFVIGRGEES